MVDISGKLEEFYNGEIPAYIKNAGKTYITITAGSDWQGNKNVKITIPAVINYYINEAGNLLSGCRTIAGLTGDWRNIDALAKEALEWFKFVSLEELRRTSRKAGLTPRF